MGVTLRDKNILNQPQMNADKAPTRPALLVTAPDFASSKNYRTGSNGSAWTVTSAPGTSA